MDAATLVQQLRSTHDFFTRSIGCLTEDDASFAPAEGMMTASEQVAHVAHTIDWFLEGAFRPEGFDMDFSKHAEFIAQYDTLAKARTFLAEAFERAYAKIGEQSAESLMTPLPEGPVMGGLPRMEIVGAIDDHSAHHRGALTVYSRLRGHVPAMPYMDM